MEYTVINYDSIESLIKVVNEYIKDGWKPLGGICLTPNSQYAGPQYAQAMIKG